VNPYKPTFRQRAGEVLVILFLLFIFLGIPIVGAVTTIINMDEISPERRRCIERGGQVQENQFGQMIGCILPAGKP
jgi:hypothetical protein